MKDFFFRMATDQIAGFPSCILKGALRVLSWVYSGIVKGMAFCYTRGILRKHQVGARVISIGNITLGGVGKTPLVEYVAEVLQQKKIKPAILIRGYMSKPIKGMINHARTRGVWGMINHARTRGVWGMMNHALTGGVCRGMIHHAHLSDEAKMLEGSLEGVPILVGKDRVSNARAFLKNNRADVFLLDDGFQHWRLSRDMDIVAIDSVNPFGNGALIPRGILREPLSALKRAHVFVLTKTDMECVNVEALKEKLKSINPHAPVIETIHKPAHFVNIKSNAISELSCVRAKKVCLLSSIGDPKSFRQTVQNLGAAIQKHFVFMDHHVYGAQEAQDMAAYCRKHDLQTIVTTQKDAVKLTEFIKHFTEDTLIAALRIKISITQGKEEFFERIHHHLAR